LTLEVINNEAESRYEISIDGTVVSFADYRVDGDTITFPHTVTDPKFRGQGLAAIVVQRALDDARAARRTVIAQCWYVAEFIGQHPEYRDLRHA
jgi:uncharacterized protein